MNIRVQREDFDISHEIRALHAGSPQVGAVASFVGLVRTDGDAGAVRAMMLEHYPGMTEKSLNEIATEAKRRWPIYAVSIIHRVGELRPAEQIVFVGVAGTHRGDAFAACEFIVDYLKTRAPFWKREQSDEGSRWVAARDTDDSAAARWSKDI